MVSAAGDGKERREKSMTGFSWNGGAAAAARGFVTGRFGRGGFLVAAEEARIRMEPFVPMDTGALAMSAGVSATDEKGSVTYSAPYAAACYYGTGVSFGTEKHPLATAFWDRAAMARK